uniref:Uncharacterized protein n=1 Tax=Panagrolaimus davidi TaxID=227884 RepID=A0A914QSY5_9BILA
MTLLLNTIIHVTIHDGRGNTPDLINAPCNTPGALSIDDYFELKRKCSVSYEAKRSIQHFSDKYHHIYTPHFHFNNSKTVKDSLNYAIESIQIQYNHLKEELKKQDTLRIPCIQEYFTQIKDTSYYNSPYYRGMKAIYINISLGIIGLLLTLIFVKELFIDLKGKTGEEKAAHIFTICSYCVVMPLLHSILYFDAIERMGAPVRFDGNLNDVDISKILLKC